MRITLFLVALLLLPLQLTFAGPLKRVIRIESVRVTIEAEPGQHGLLVTLSSPNSTTIETLLLDNSPRAVFDILGASTKKSAEIAIDSELIATLRSGQHPDRLRIVLDLRRPDVTLETLGSGKFRLAAAAALDAKPSATPTASPAPTSAAVPAAPTILSAVRNVITPPPTPEPTAQPTPETDTSPAPSPTPSATVTPLPTHTPSPIATPAPNVAPPQAVSPSASARTDRRMSGIHFEYVMPDNRPIVKLLLSGRGSFTLERAGPRTFELRIANCSLTGPQLELPYFPPHDFLGISYVSPRQEGANVVVTIGVEQGVRVASLPNQDEIWIRTVNR